MTEPIIAERQPLACPPVPCGSCPYRRDTPPGIWAAEEYEKLPEYDADAQPPAIAVFHCHQETATGIPTVCKGWLSVHGFDSVAVRIAVCFGLVTAEQVEAPCPVPLYASGREACDAGLAGVDQPGAAARKVIRKLVMRRMLRRGRR